MKKSIQNMLFENKIKFTYPFTILWAVVLHICYLFSNNKFQKVKILVLLSIGITISCYAQEKPPIWYTINFDHFNHLYQEVNFKGKKVGIIHIYSQFPDYKYAIEPKEGFTCVDDVARAIVMLSKYIKGNEKDEDARNKLKNLTEFVVQMQNENGYFNNFIWENLSINTSYKTSIAELNWWSFRALWALETAYPLLKRSDEDLANRIVLALKKLIANIKRDLPLNNIKTAIVKDIEMPTWLPHQYAADQSALLILGLLKNYERTADQEIKTMIYSLAKGIMIMQKGNANNYPFGVFLSWENLWHAWGNNQAYALLKAGQKFKNKSFIDSAFKEIDNFYPYLLKTGFSEAFFIKKTGDGFKEIKRNNYPQIAYGLRPMVWAASEAYHYSKKEKYLKLTLDLGSWLRGNNDVKTGMYNDKTGICFDGILSPETINKNSGAESTIESILILLEMNPLK